MSLTTFLLFFLTETALAFVPGPAVLFVLGTALKRGFRASVGATLGVLSANAIYFIASAFGLGLVIAKAEPVFIALKWLGAAYLVYLGVAALRAKPYVHAATTQVDVAQSTRPAWQAFLAALALQLGNPKAILFFTALLPQFVKPDAAWSVPFQIFVLGVTSIVSELFVLLGYGALAARAAAATQNPRLLANFERASGFCLLGCAALALAA